MADKLDYDQEAHVPEGSNITSSSSRQITQRNRNTAMLSMYCIIFMSFLIFVGFLASAILLGQGHHDGLIPMIICLVLLIPLGMCIGGHYMFIKYERA